MSIIDEIQRDVQSAEALTSWLGQGGVPVGQVQAEHRALSCMTGDAGRECHFHTAPRWWEVSKLVVAEWIRRQLGVKHKLGLSTPMDVDLKMCSRCGCCTLLKIWTPIEHIRDNLTPGTIETYPAWCWQRQEILNQ